MERVTLDFLVSLLVRWRGVRMGIFFLTVFLIGRGWPGGYLLSLGRPRESKQREGRPGETPPDGGSLRYSTNLAAAELAIAAARQGLRQSSPTPPDSFALLGVSQGSPPTQ